MEDNQVDYCKDEPRIEYYKYPSWCCQHCGEPIGWLGRAFQILGTSFHTCTK